MRGGAQLAFVFQIHREGQKRSLGQTRRGTRRPAQFAVANFATLRQRANRRLNRGEPRGCQKPNHRGGSRQREEKLREQQTIQRSARERRHTGWRQRLPRKWFGVFLRVHESRNITSSELTQLITDRTSV